MRELSRQGIEMSGGVAPSSDYQRLEKGQRQEPAATSLLSDEKEVFSMRRGLLRGKAPPGRLGTW